jgi:hypothetical protein
MCCDIGDYLWMKLLPPKELLEQGCDVSSSWVLVFLVFTSFCSRSGRRKNGGTSTQRAFNSSSYFFNSMPIFSSKTRCSSLGSTKSSWSTVYCCRSLHLSPTLSNSSKLPWSWCQKSLHTKNSGASTTIKVSWTWR